MSAIFCVPLTCAMWPTAKKIADMGGLTVSNPVLGWGLVLGVVAVAGLPPLGIFMSEFLVVSSTFARQPWLAIILAFGILVALVQVSSQWRTILLPPTLYLAAFVWETRLAAEPAITRQLMIGAILIVMMNARPQGLFGSRRVEALT